MKDDIYTTLLFPSQILELQNTLDDLTTRVDAVKEENLKLRSENTVLGQYIENLMHASSVFQAVSPKSKHYKKASQGQLGSVVRVTTKAAKSVNHLAAGASSSVGTPSSTSSQN